MVNSRFRFVFIRLAVLIMFGLLVFRLFNLQIVNGDRYNEITKSRMNVNMIEKAPRGQIYDRYGNPLVVNRAGYSLQLLKTDITEKEFNEMLLELRETIEETGDEFSDSLPISDYPFEFEFESEDAVKNKFSTLLTVENDNISEYNLTEESSLIPLSSVPNTSLPLQSAIIQLNLNCSDLLTLSFQYQFF